MYKPWRTPFEDSTILGGVTGSRPESRVKRRGERCFKRENSTNYSGICVIILRQEQKNIQKIVLSNRNKKQMHGTHTRSKPLVGMLCWTSAVTNSKNLAKMMVPLKVVKWSRSPRLSWFNYGFFLNFLGFMDFYRKLWTKLWCLLGHLRSGELASLVCCCPGGRGCRFFVAPFGPSVLFGFTH